MLDLQHQFKCMAKVGKVASIVNNFKTFMLEGSYVELKSVKTILCTIIV